MISSVVAMKKIKISDDLCHFQNTKAHFEYGKLIDCSELKIVSTLSYLIFNHKCRNPSNRKELEIFIFRSIYCNYRVEKLRGNHKSLNHKEEVQSK